MQATGPKVSSTIMFMSGVTSIKITGFILLPLVSLGFPKSIFAPFETASSICRSTCSFCEWLIIEPTWTIAACLINFWMNSFFWPSITKIFSVLTQTCPVFLKLLFAANSAAFSKSASSRIISGSFPPSSNITLLNSFAACSRICFPVDWEPVKVISCTSDSTNSRPWSPVPITTWRTSSGSVLFKIWAYSIPTKGTSSEGLKRTVFPAIKLGIIRVWGMPMGKFQGVMLAHTPKGSQ